MIFCKNKKRYENTNTYANDLIDLELRKLNAWVMNIQDSVSKLKTIAEKTTEFRFCGTCLNCEKKCEAIEIGKKCRNANCDFKELS